MKINAKIVGQTKFSQNTSLCYATSKSIPAKMMSISLFFFNENRTTNARQFPRIPTIPNVVTR